MAVTYRHIDWYHVGAMGHHETWPLFYGFLSIQTVCRAPWTGDWHVARPLPSYLHRATETPSKGRQTFMLRVAFDLTIPMFEREKTFRILHSGHCDRCISHLKI